MSIGWSETLAAANHLQKVDPETVISGKGLIPIVVFSSDKLKLKQFHPFLVSSLCLYFVCITLKRNLKKKKGTCTHF